MKKSVACTREAPAVLQKTPQGRMGEAGETPWKAQPCWTMNGGPRFLPDPFSSCLVQRLVGSEENIAGKVFSSPPWKRNMGLMWGILSITWRDELH